MSKREIDAVEKILTDPKSSSRTGPDDAPAISGADASAWLREHFKDDPEPRVDITWEVTEPNDAVFREVLEILFAPEPGETAA